MSAVLSYTAIIPCFAWDFKLVFRAEIGYTVGVESLFMMACMHVRASGALREEVKKTQVSYFARRMYACVSAGPRKGTVRLSISLDRRLQDRRVEQAVQIRPALWTHHIVLSCPEDLDETVDAWLVQARLLAQ